MPMVLVICLVRLEATGYRYRSGNITIQALYRCDGANKGVYMTCDEEAKTSGSKKCETLSLKRWIDEKKTDSLSLYLIKREYVKLRISFSSLLEF